MHYYFCVMRFSATKLITTFFTTLGCLFFVGSLLFFSRSPVNATAPWYSTDWQYRKKITIDADRVVGAANFSNFVMLVNRTDTNWRTTSNGGHIEQADGGDILFSANDGTTKLDHEIESYNPTTGELVAWVEIPTLDYNDDTDIYVYYGNSTGVADQSDPAGTWAADYAAVWHLQEDVVDEQSSGSHNDSTSNNNDGSQSGNVEVVGKIGLGQQFDGVDDTISVPDVNSLDITRGTLSAWVNFSNLDNVNFPVLLAKSPVNGAYMLGLDFDNTPYWRIHNGSVQTADDTNEAQLSTWEYLTGTYDGGLMYFYRNGILAATLPAPGNITNSSGNFFMGTSDGTASNAFAGILDEVRISSTVRSRSWIQTEYNNQNSPSTFYTVGTESASALVEAPTNTSPASDSLNTVANPTLQGSAFTSFIGNTHQASQWQVTSTSGDYSSPVFDSGTDTGNLTSRSISIGTLQRGTTYYWRVRYQDNANNWSRYSDETSFTTIGAWQYVRSITIDNTKVAGSVNLADFPILIDVTHADLKSTSNGGHVQQTDGGDIMFATGESQPKLDHEIESYDPATGHLVVWVEIPTLDYDNDTTLSIYYGNSSNIADQESPTGTWSNAFAGVWHLDESATDEQSNTVYADSSGNAISGNQSGTAQSSGKIGSAQSFDGNNDFILMHAPEIANGNITISTWLKYSGTGLQSPLSLRNGDDSPVETAVLVANLNTSGDLDGRSNGVNAIASAGTNNGAWHHIVFRRNGTTTELYVDGQLAASNTSAQPNNGPQKLTLGSNNGGYYAASLSQYFAGDIDETQISTSERSADWIATEYNNQNDPATFSTLGSELSVSAYQISLTESSGSTQVTEGGATDTYTVELNLAPTDNVTVSVTSLNTSTGVTVNPSTLQFTTSNWNVPQTVTVTAVDDNNDEGQHTAQITHVASSNDANFSGTNTTLTTTVVDNDDATAPTFSSISASTTGTSATVTWTTNEAASSQVEYGLTSSYGSTTAETDTSPYVTSHTVQISGLTKCRTYHYRVKSTDASDNQGVSSDYQWFTTSCEDVFPGLAASCDDTNPNGEIRVRTNGNITTVRNSALTEIFGSTVLPSGQPDSVQQNIATPTYIDTTDTTNLSSIDRLTINLDQNFVSYVYMLHPVVSNNRLVLLHQGHSDNLYESGVEETLNYYLARGFTILAFHMPENGPNTGPVNGSGSTAHDNMQSLESVSFNPLEIFVAPMAIALNYTDANYNFQNVTAVGISGGGWTTTMYAALDPRISLSFPVAGSLPRFLRTASCNPNGVAESEDYEQGTAGKPSYFFSNVASYLDLYLLGGVADGRKQIQILNQYDPCCFNGLRYNVYEQTVADIATALGGFFDVASDTTHSIHTISNWARTSVMLPELKETASKTESGGSTSVIENTSPTDTYTVVLNSQPISDVTVTAQSDNTTTGVTISPSSRTFTNSNWSTPQTFTVTAVDDGTTEGNHTATISHTISSSDELYNAISLSSVTVNITDPTNQAAPAITLTALTSDPGSDTTPTITGSAAAFTGTVNLVQYQIDSTSGSWASCTADDGTFNEVTEAFSCTVDPALSDGNHTIYVRSRGSNNATTADADVATDTFQIDTTEPADFNLVSPEDNAVTRDQSPTFRWKQTTDSLSGLAKYQVVVNGIVHIDNIDPNDPGAGANFVRDTDTVHIRYDNGSIEAYAKSSESLLPAGTWKWEVRAIDRAGKTRSTGSRTLTIDLDAPYLQLDSFGQWKNLNYTTTVQADRVFTLTDRTPTFRGTTSSQSQVHVSIDGDAIICNDEAENDGAWSCTPSRLDFGYHRVAISAKDTAGNTTVLPTLRIYIGSGKLDVSVDESTSTPLANQLEDGTEEIINQESTPTYKVSIKVLGKNGQPVLGAKVTLFSEPKQTTTDENGVARFEEVEKGDHQVVVDYDGFVGKQDVRVDGDVAEYAFTVTVQKKSPLLAPLVLGVIGVLALTILSLIAFIWKTRLHR